MSYRVPPGEVLAVAINDVLRENGTISSQRLFADLVREKLRCLDKDYTVTEDRVRRVALLAKLVDVEISTRDTGVKVKGGRCPVCASRLRKVKNGTIYGGSVTLGFKCVACPFTMGATRCIPTRYSFHESKRRTKYRPRKNAQRRL